MQRVALSIMRAAWFFDPIVVQRNTSNMYCSSVPTFRHTLKILFTAWSYMFEARCLIFRVKPDTQAYSKNIQFLQWRPRMILRSYLLQHGALSIERAAWFVDLIVVQVHTSKYYSSYVATFSHTLLILFQRRATCFKRAAWFFELFMIRQRTWKHMVPVFTDYSIPSSYFICSA